MALYIGGGRKQKVILNGVVGRLNLFIETPITNFTKLLSSDNHILKDINGLYLTTLTETPITNLIRLLSSDNYILKDLNGLYLTLEEDE